MQNIFCMQWPWKQGEGTGKKKREATWHEWEELLVLVADERLVESFVAIVGCGMKEREETKIAEERERGGHGGYSTAGEEQGW